VSERTVKHATNVVERKFKSSPARVFAAWADPDAYGRWNFPGDDWEMTEYENDFRVGGREKKRFGPKGDPKFSSDASYLDIVPEARRYFGGVRIGKSYVAYYLMGVYGDPGLIARMSPELRKRMQGTSCFNFRKIDEELFAELAVLTERTATHYPKVLDAFLAGRL